MRIATTFRPHLGGSYETISQGAVEAERLGFEAIFLPDHLLPAPDFHRAGSADAEVTPLPSGDGLERGPGPTDPWMILAGLARDTSTIRLGTLVTNLCFRSPSMTAVSVATVNEMSGGRIDFGIGTGWLRHEHTMYGIPFPDQNERFERLEDLLEIVKGLWGSENPFSFEGRHVSLDQAVPASVSRGIAPARILTGGKGLRRTPRLAARFCDEVNAATSDVEGAMTFFQACDDACERIGRDPRSLARSISLRVQCGEDDADLRRKTEALGSTLEETRSVHFAGTPDELIEVLRPFEQAGIDRVILARRPPVDLPGLRLIGENVLPAFSASR